VHGSTPEEITAYTSQLNAGFSGFGIGSLVPRKASFEHLVDIIYAVRSCTDAPLHAFGITGFPALFALAYLGVDTFDSWTYVVAAAYKEYVDPNTLSRIRNLKQRDALPECQCSICQEYGLADFIGSTSEAEMLLSLHNLNVFLEEMRAVREAISDGMLEDYIVKRGTGGNRNILKAFGLAKKKVREGR
jgi:tRNA-guanine family transglycosylase